MRFRIALAFSVSVLLIGSAFWFRLSNKSAIQYGPELVELSAKKSMVQESDLENNLTEPGELKAEPISQTDSLGRRLISDYVSLAASGEADVDPEALALTYIESVSHITNAPVLSLGDIKVVANSSLTIQAYKNNFSKIYQEYLQRTDEINISDDDISSMGDEFLSSISKLGAVYKDTAKKLKSISVPVSLAELHLNITNIYLSNAVAAEALAGVSADPAKAFAGLVTLGKNTETERAALSKINQAITPSEI